MMPASRKKFLVPAAIVLSLALTPMIAGCSGNPIQNIVKGATGGQVDIGGTTVPADFPSEVPLMSGEVISAVSLGANDDKVWNISIKAASASAIDGIADQLTGAGFTTVGGNLSMEEGSANIFTKDTLSVLVVMVKGDDGTYVANYSVSHSKPGS